MIASAAPVTHPWISSAPEVRSAHISELPRLTIFDALDADGDGRVSMEELAAIAI